MKYFKTSEDLHDSVITTFKMYLQDDSKVLCVMKKCARILRLLLNAYRSKLEIIYLRNYSWKTIILIQQSLTLPEVFDFHS